MQDFSKWFVGKLYLHLCSVIVVVEKKSVQREAKCCCSSMLHSVPEHSAS